MADASQAVTALYGDGVPLNLRFPDVSGAVLVDQIFSAYQVGENITIPWFDQHGRPNIQRHPLNMRKQDSVLERYVASILEKGIVTGVRSEAWMIFSPNRTFPALALSYGTLAEALYTAVERDPDNTFVVNAVRKGLPNVRMLNEQTPSNVLSFLKAYNNEFHGGSSWTIVELMEEALDLEVQWGDHRSKKGINAKMPNYEGLYWNFVKERCHGHFKSWKQFDSGKSLAHSLQKFNVFEDCKDWSGKYCDFLHERYDTSTHLICGHSLITKINESTGRQIDKALADLVGIVFLEAWKFCQPCVASGDQRDVPWIFSQNNSSTAATMDLINTVMTDSQLVKKEKTKALKAALELAEAVEEHAEHDSPRVEAARGSKRRRVAAKPKAKGKATMPAGDRERREVIMAVRDDRPLTWINDLIAAVDHARQEVRAHVKSDVLTKATHLVMSFALEFVWTGQVTIANKTFKAWTLLRHELQGIIKQLKANDTTKDIADMAEEMLRKVQGQKTEVCDTEVDKNPGDIFDEFVRTNQEAAARLKAFIMDNKLSLPVRCHLRFTSTMASCVEQLQRTDRDALNVPQVVDIFGNLIFAAISPEWLLPQPLVFQMQFLHA